MRIQKKAKIDMLLSERQHLSDCDVLSALRVWLLVRCRDANRMEKKKR